MLKIDASACSTTVPQYHSTQYHSTTVPQQSSQYTHHAYHKYLRVCSKGRTRVDPSETRRADPAVLQYSTAVPMQYMHVYSTVHCTALLPTRLALLAYARTTVLPLQVLTGVLWYGWVD